MKVLLIAPPFYRLFRYPGTYFPLGLGYVAASVRKAGHDVRILHADYDQVGSAPTYAELIADYPLFRKGLRQRDHPCWKEIAGAVHEFRPDVVGCSAMTVYLESAWKVLEIAKETLPRVTTVLGGPAATANPADAMLRGSVDFAISGEGEIASVELVQALERRDYLGLRNIAGLSWRGEHGQAHSNARGPWIDVNMLERPARGLLSFKEYPADLYGSMITARGCPYHCAFCNSSAVWGQRMRFRSVASVVEEVEATQDRFGTTYFHFFDDVFTVNKRRIQRLLQAIIDRELPIHYWCNTRLDTLDEELLDLLARSGCDNLSVGIESGSDRILRSVNKGMSRSTIEDKLRIVERSGPPWSAFFMIGFPQERVEDLELTLELMRQVNPPRGIVFSIFTPYEGTPLYEDCRRLGLIPKDVDDWSRFSHQSPENYFAPEVPRELFREYVGRAIAIADESGKQAKGLEESRSSIDVLSQTGSTSGTFRAARDEPA
jgi:anaerobic magnesium-protoporphyrin IX monomethyl ester cyclase